MAKCLTRPSTGSPRYRAVPFVDKMSKNSIRSEETYRVPMKSGHDGESCTIMSLERSDPKVYKPSGMLGEQRAAAGDKIEAKLKARFSRLSSRVRVYSSVLLQSLFIFVEWQLKIYLPVKLQCRNLVHVGPNPRQTALNGGQPHI